MPNILSLRSYFFQILRKGVLVNQRNIFLGNLKKIKDFVPNKKSKILFNIGATWPSCNIKFHHVINMKRVSVVLWFAHRKAMF